MFTPTVIAALMAAAFTNTVEAASTFQSKSTRNLSHVKNGSKTTQHTDALKNLLLQELFIKKVLL